MAKVILESTDTQYTIANNNVEVKGASGSQTLVVNSGVTGLSFDSTIEDVDFSGNVADYTFSQNGAGDLTVHDSSGTAIATISGANGKTLSFADGTVALETTFDADTGTGGINLGGAAVGTTSAAVTPTTIDSSDTSSNAPASTPGQSFTMTPSSSGDLFTGTDGNDTFTGAAGTIQAADVLVDSSSTDSDVANLTISGTVGQFTSANVETVNLAFDLSSNVDVTKVSGANVVNVSSGTAGNTAATLLGLGSSVQNVVSGSDIATLGIQGTSSSSDSVKVTTTASTLALTESTTEIETIEVATSGTASNVTLSLSGTGNKLVASGDANLTLTENSAGDFALANVTSITDSTDAAATLTVKSLATGATDYSGIASTAVLDLTGAVAAAITLNNSQSSVKMSGTIGVAGATFTAKSGSSNTLNLVAAADQANAITTSGYTTVNLTYGLTDSTSADLGNITASGATINISGAGDFVLDGTNTFSKLDATNATGKVTALLASTANSFTGGSGNDTAQLASDTSFTFTGGAGTDTLDMNHNGAANLSDNDVQLSSVDVIDVGGVNNTATFAAKQLTGQTMTFLGAGGNDDVTITTVATGDTADLSNVSQSGIQTFTITGNTGADTLSGSKGVDVITGGAGNDVITGGEGGDTITGEAGNDTINLTETVAAVDTVVFSVIATNGSDTITGFTAGTGGDLLNVELLAAGNVAGETAIAANASTTDLTDQFVGVFADGADGAGSEAIADYTDMTDVASFLAAGLTEADAENYAIVINDLVNDKAYVYNVDVNAVSATADTIEAGDVTLVGTITMGNADTAITTANTDFTA